MVYAEAKHPETLKLILEKKDLTDEVKKKIDALLTEFKKQF